VLTVTGQPAQWQQCIASLKSPAVGQERISQPVGQEKIKPAMGQESIRPVISDFLWLCSVLLQCSDTVDRKHITDSYLQILRNTTSFSALTLLVASFDLQKPSLKWPIMCLVGR